MFKYIFDKLSIASKEAVIDGNHANIDNFKDYLHVDREVDALLENID
ncbi:hypothetical protein [Pedobacter ginsenosidimutans]|nr:hypothetical protein [Pedobacter ginsenosidimutans]